MSIRIKLGVVIAGLTPEGDILDPAFEAALIWSEQGWGDVTITGNIPSTQNLSISAGTNIATASNGLDVDYLYAVQQR